MSKIKTAELIDALKDLAAKRGTPMQWITRSNAVTHFLAELPKETRVFCRGEVHLPDKGHFPAVLTYNPIYRQTLAWAPSDRKDRMEAHHVAFFHSSIPHAGIARESLMDRETRVVVSTQGTSGSAQDPQGLDPEDAGPVGGNADAKNPYITGTTL